MSSPERKNPFKISKEVLGDRTYVDYYYKNFTISISLLQEITNGAIHGYRLYLTMIQQNLEKEVNKMNPEQLQTYNQFLERDRSTWTPSEFKEAENKIKDQTVKDLLTKSLYSYGVLQLGEPFLREMILVYLIAQFENFLEQSLSSVIENDLRILLTNLSADDDKTITYKDVIENIDDIKEFIADTESKKILNKNLDEISKFLKYLGLDLTKNSDWEQFKECFYRRHIIIHNNGVPDKEYCKNTRYSGEIVRLVTNEKYLSDAFSIFTNYASLFQDHLSKKFKQK